MLVVEYKADREIPDEDETSQKRFQQTNVSYEMETFPGKGRLSCFPTVTQSNRLKKPFKLLLTCLHLAFRQKNIFHFYKRKKEYP